MEINLKQRDCFYNNGITNVFWATLKQYDVEYESLENSYIVTIDGVNLKLSPFSLSINGDKENIKKWYKNVSRFLIKVGLDRKERLIYDFENKRFKKGHSYIIRSFASRVWGTKVGSEFVSRTSLSDNFNPFEVTRILKNYIAKTGETSKQLLSKKLLPKEFINKGVNKNEWVYKNNRGKNKKVSIYIQTTKDTITNKLLLNRYCFKKSTSDNCELCGSTYTIFSNKENTSERYKRDSAVVPTVIGLNYAGFKDLAVSDKNVVCAFCDLVMRYCFFWTFYSSFSNKSIVLLFDVPNLTGLFRLKLSMSIEMDTLGEKEVSNLTSVFPILSVERALLALIIEVYKRVKRTSSAEDVQIILSEYASLLRVYGLFFTSKGISDFIEYHKLIKFLHLLSKLDDNKALTDILAKGCLSLVKDSVKDYYERKLLRKLLNFQEIFTVLREISYLKIKKDIYFTPFDKKFENILPIYYNGFIDMENRISEEKLELLEKLGRAIGTLAHALNNNKGDKGIFYDLREAKKLEHLETVLCNFSFRLLKAEEVKKGFVKQELSIYTEYDKKLISLIEKNELEWNNARDILTFFAVNTFIRHKKNNNVK